MTTAIRNLGQLDGPVLIFGGPYSNLAATRAMRTEAESLGVAPQQTLCTGDVVAYCAEPEETIGLVRDWGVPVIMGNCEEALARNAPDCGCGFEEQSTCSALSVEWYRYASERVSAASRAWMSALPRSLCFEFNGRSFQVVHGGISRINRFLFAATADEVFRDELSRTQTDIVLAGHCGIPFKKDLDGRLWLNAGVIGMPANDGTPDGWYMLLQPEADKLRASWHRLSYDAEAARQRMIAAGLKSGYAETLKSGLWPSEDVLPDTEKARRGQPLVLNPIVF